MNYYGHSQGGPQTENENQPPSVQDKGHNVSPQGNDQDPSKDKNPESGYSQIKSQVKTLAEKLRIIEGSNARGSVNLDNLTNFP